MKNNNQNPGRRIARIASALAGLCLSAAAASSHAGDFSVRVIDELGVPVAGASVCIGLVGNYTQFGTAFTDLDGNIPAVDVPNLPFVVTISKTRFAGMRVHEPARGFNISKQMTLTTGLPGPRCRADTTLADAPNAPRILVRAMDVRSTDGRTTLIPEVLGGPSEYRIGASEEFLASANWNSLGSQIALPLELAQNESVFLQLRRFEGSRNSWLEARSSVITVDLGQVQ